MNLPGDPPQGAAPCLNQMPSPSSEWDGPRSPGGYRGQLALDLSDLPPRAALPEQLHRRQQGSQLPPQGPNLELSVGTGSRGCQALGHALR